MADPIQTRAPTDDADDDDEGTPRWVWAFGIIIAVLVLGFVVLHLMGGGFPAHTFP
jgi:hypothetical protein